MTSYCKTLDPADYGKIHETKHAQNIKAIVGTFGGRAEHPHRAWEYGIVLHALREHGCKTLLDVGGGGSCFAPAAAWPDVGMQVTQVDPEGYEGWVAQQSKKIGRPITYERADFMHYGGREDFDAVVSISVLEHVGDDFAFFSKLARHVRVGGVVALTVDFWPDGAQKSGDHLRTYNEDRIQALFESVPGLEPLGPFDYADHGAHVYSYTFASMIARRSA